MRSRPFFWSVDPFFNLFMVILLFLNPIQRLTKQHHCITAPKFHPTIQLDRSVKISECSGCIKTSGASASFNNYQPTQLCHGSKPWPLVRFSANVAEPVTKALAKPHSFWLTQKHGDVEIHHVFLYSIAISSYQFCEVEIRLYYIERWEYIRNIQFHRCNFSFFQQTAWIYSIRLSWIFQAKTAQERLTFCLHCGSRLSWRRPRLQHRYGEALVKNHGLVVIVHRKINNFSKFTSEFRMFELTQLTHINVHVAEVTHMLAILTLGSTRRYIISHLVKPKFQPYEKKCYKNPFERILPDFNMTSMKFRVRNTSGRMPLHSSGKACTWKPSSSDFRFEAQRPKKKKNDL